MEMEENLFVKPEYNGNHFKNPSSFVGWTGLPNVLAILRWMLEPNSGRPPSKQVSKMERLDGDFKIAGKNWLN